MRHQRPGGPFDAFGGLAPRCIGAVSRRDASGWSSVSGAFLKLAEKGRQLSLREIADPKNGVCASQRNALRGSERFKINGDSGKAIHLNQKPLDLTTMIIKASSDSGDGAWEPFGGLFTACIAARNLRERCHFLGRRRFSAL